MAKSDVGGGIELIAYTVEQAAAALGIDKERMGAMIRAGSVPHISLGARRLVGKAALERWLTEACLANATAEISTAPTRPTPLRRRRAARGPTA